MPDHMNLGPSGDSSSLIFSVGLPADAAVFASGHEPNGYFWEGVAQYLNRREPLPVSFDCEGSMFCAVGDRGPLEQLRTRLLPYLDSPELITQLISDAEASGFEFDD